jgi:hypothetical protein
MFQVEIAAPAFKLDQRRFAGACYRPHPSTDERTKALIRQLEIRQWTAIDDADDGCRASGELAARARQVSAR